ncbi:MAG TPA: diaminopimelate epimerase [Acidimicrobiales bacterium]|nr:diaminopimelate epimerase [Acidimicrobiales bacterium]
MRTLALEKYEALGNDFLVVVDLARAFASDGRLAAALCDRHAGVGADGLIWLRPGASPGAVRMELRNADGSRAETSGNGLRCAALAAARAGLVDGAAFSIDTDAGAHAVRLESAAGAAGVVAVDMGPLEVAEEACPPLRGHRSFRVDAGNPHLVILGPIPDEGTVAALGARLEAATPGGVNVEFVVPHGRGELELVVWERGAGLTRACGSGSCAAAGAARLAGVTGDRVVVHNPGGPLTVELSGTDPARPRARLVGPARHVAGVTVDLEELGAREPAGA